MPNPQVVSESSVMPTYSRFPVEMAKAKGSYIWDSEGLRYLDFTSGIAVCNLGHVPEQVKEKVEEQLNTLWHCSNLYHIPAQEQLAAKLTALSCHDKVFFCNSGAEANEAAIKLARRYSKKVKQSEAFEIVTFKHSFHGRTMATLSATGQEKIQDGFVPLLEGFSYLPYNDSEALEQLSGQKTCAVLLELVQGEGGVIPADLEWVQALEKKCQAEGILLMVDEIQTGIGRTGTLFAYEQYGILPDVMTLAKGLGSGFPIGAMLAKAEAAKAFEPGSHGSTFGGNPLAATAGLATLDVFESDEILETAQKNGKYLLTALQDLQAQFPDQIKEVRGKGLLLGLVTTTEAIKIVNKARDLQVLVLVAGPNVVRILPPLTTTEAEIDACLAVLKDVFQQL
ncbi:acetylornithine aminotransferase [Pullulanibacillus pueri]|uniref:Acetylornithine aminotransferase n=1 Tax=Pullulanibacillus pueri TaxID=1437324 RepID=A0A8J2ZYN9_9BACL|nr:acetylornithine transaminase [Pullulanibacillus pueri]MBM7683230.1 acetylornithine aminotransferase [Pullulanibacillus pueri]GGH85507.1 acetylornithine aminotransferase [Pullulanibacillus pueri]